MIRHLLMTKMWLNRKTESGKNFKNSLGPKLQPQLTIQLLVYRQTEQRRLFRSRLSGASRARTETRRFYCGMRSPLVIFTVDSKCSHIAVKASEGIFHWKYIRHKLQCFSTCCKNLIDRSASWPLHPFLWHRAHAQATFCGLHVWMCIISFLTCILSWMN